MTTLSYHQGMKIIRDVKLKFWLYTLALFLIAWASTTTEGWVKWFWCVAWITVTQVVGHKIPDTVIVDES